MSWFKRKDPKQYAPGTLRVVRHDNGLFQIEEYVLCDGDYIWCWTSGIPYDTEAGAIEGCKAIYRSRQYEPRVVLP